jgi:predicted ATP-dependent serine protease
MKGRQRTNRHARKKGDADLDVSMPRIVAKRAADVKPQRLRRMWGGRFFRGKIGFIAGDPGLGKSQIAAYMAATVSTGGTWPGNKGPVRRGWVVYISAEDTAADTIRPRLEAAGADLKRVLIVEMVKDKAGLRPFNWQVPAIRLSAFRLCRTRSPNSRVSRP